MPSPHDPSEIESLEGLAERVIKSEQGFSAERKRYADVLIAIQHTQALIDASGKPSTDPENAKLRAELEQYQHIQKEMDADFHVASAAHADNVERLEQGINKRLH